MKQDLQVYVIHKALYTHVTKDIAKIAANCTT